MLGMNKLDIAKRAQILAMLCEGASMRSVSRLADVSFSTVAKLLVSAGRFCAGYHDDKVRGVAAKRVQVDEIWSFTAAKAKNVKAMKKPVEGAGDTWTIKQHKAQLASDRTSCRSPLANQMRLILHTGAYWLLLGVRDAIPSWNPLRHTEFATIRLRLLKIASRIIETASRIRVALASCCPEAELFSLLALGLQPSGP